MPGGSVPGVLGDSREATVPGVEWSEREETGNGAREVKRPNKIGPAGNCKSF